MIKHTGLTFSIAKGNVPDNVFWEANSMKDGALSMWKDNPEQGVSNGRVGLRLSHLRIKYL